MMREGKGRKKKKKKERLKKQDCGSIVFPGKFWWMDGYIYSIVGFKSKCFIFGGIIIKNQTGERAHWASEQLPLKLATKGHKLLANILIIPTDLNSAL